VKSKTICKQQEYLESVDDPEVARITGLYFQIDSRVYNIMRHYLTGKKLWVPEVCYKKER
jgi:hypothetical protein